MGVTYQDVHRMRRQKKSMFEQLRKMDIYSKVKIKCKIMDITIRTALREMARMWLKHYGEKI